MTIAFRHGMSDPRGSGQPPPSSSSSSSSSSSAVSRASLPREQVHPNSGEMAAYSPSLPSSASSSSFSSAPKQKRFPSRRKIKADIKRPWIGKKDRQRIWHLIFPLVGIFLGVAFTGFCVYQGMAAVPQHAYCLILDEDFSSGSLDASVWTHEVQVGGFGYVSVFVCWGWIYTD